MSEELPDQRHGKDDAHNPPHHRKLGAASPLSSYLDMLKNTSTDSMPFLWSKERLKAEVAEGIRTVARSVRQEMEDMYTTIAKPLIDEHPDLFGPSVTGNKKNKNRFSGTTEIITHIESIELNMKIQFALIYCDF